MIRRLAAASCVLSLACAGSSPTTPPPPRSAPVISCSGPLQALSRASQPPPTVTFDAPTVEGGEPPLTVSCTPASGSEFPNGSTEVSCAATDSLGRSASCRFTITVEQVPRITRTTFLAFGDSLTEGKKSLLGHFVPDLPGSYPRRLQTKLAARYQDQTITVTPSGFGGEVTDIGKRRLREELAAHRPEVVLLLEGTNDLLQPGTNTDDGLTHAITSAASALRDMIRDARASGAHVFIATLPAMHERRGNGANGVQPLNDRIRALASTEGATLVDLFAVVPLSMIGADGLHPKEETYDTIAEEWFKAITTALEVRAP